MRPDSHEEEWFTASEIAAVVAASETAVELPKTKRGVNLWIGRMAREFPSFASDLEHASRPRAGRKGGGGKEYHWSLFESQHTRAAALALRSEIERRRGACIPRAAINYLDPHRDADGLKTFSEYDRAIMMRMLGEDASLRPPYFVDPLVRRVRRGAIHIGRKQYWHHSLSNMNGTDVWVTTVERISEPNIVFIWRYDAWLDQLVCHGEDGIICMAEGFSPYEQRPYA